jgi:hypothetical protein
MLETFVRVHDLELVLLQEVTHQFNTPFSGYDIHYNIGSSRRATAFLLRNTLMATNLSRIPSGRAMAVGWGDPRCQHIRPFWHIKTPGEGNILQ